MKFLLIIAISILLSAQMFSCMPTDLGNIKNNLMKLVQKNLKNFDSNNLRVLTNDLLKNDFVKKLLDINK